jgi:hypothetical protein
VLPTLATTGVPAPELLGPWRPAQSMSPRLSLTQRKTPERKTKRVLGLAYALMIGGGVLASLAFLYVLASIVLGWRVQ